jgi:RNA-directed DNA polymerase
MKQSETEGGKRSQQMPGAPKQTQDNLPWRSLEQQVVRMQKQIAQAAQRGDRQAVYSLQQRLMESEAARLLAVRRVAEENAGKDTAGVDGIKSLSPQERLAMASTIHPKYWSYQPPMPVRRVWIPKPGTSERRPLAILPMIDRCKQALVKLALEPEWETRFEPHSYGYRPGRSAHDALAAIVVAIERHPMFVFDADIAEAFDHLNQALVLDKLQTYPALRQVIHRWLTAGTVEGTTFAVSEMGITQGGVLSPLLLNIALHGMEAVVTDGAENGRLRDRMAQPLLVRYADDFVILHPELETLQQAIRRARRWLASMGLHLHAQKTRITHTLTPYQGQVGFDFLGFSIRQEHKPPRVGAGLAPVLDDKPGVQTIIAPSQEASKRHLAAIDARLHQLQTASQAQVIKELNPLVIGWTAYYNGVVPAATLGRYDDLVEQRLLKWASKRHPDKERDWLLARYWQRTGKKKVFATRDGVQLRAYRQVSILKG